MAPIFAAMANRISGWALLARIIWSFPTLGALCTHTRGPTLIALCVVAITDVGALLGCCVVVDGLFKVRACGLYGGRVSMFCCCFPLSDFLFCLLGCKLRIELKLLGESGVPDADYQAIADHFLVGSLNCLLVYKAL